MAKFRVARHLKRDIVTAVTYIEDGVVKNQRRLFPFYNDNDINSEGWFESDDVVLIQSLKDQKEKLPFSEQAEQGLKQSGIPYEYAYCPSCGGKKVRKLEYKLFEVID